MERENKAMPALCLSGCGFHGNPATEGLCSVCYKESQKKKDQEPSRTNRGSIASANSGMISKTISSVTTMTSGESLAALSLTDISTAKPTISNSLPDLVQDEATASNSTGVGESSEDQDSEKDLKKKKNRCGMCRKKVGLTGIQCRCGGTFCGLHRYTDTHGCTFDYRTLGAQEISQSNPRVVCDKIQKI